MQLVSTYFGVARSKALALSAARSFPAKAAAFVLAKYVARALSTTSELKRSRAIPDGRSAV